MRISIKMKRAGMIFRTILIISIVFAGPVMSLSGVRIKVTNTSSAERPNAVVCVRWGHLGLPAGNVGKATVIVDEAAGKEVISQVLDENSDGTPENLLFICSLKPGEEKWFSVEPFAETAAAQSLVNTQYPLPRRDIAWENDRIAYRIYGSPLAGDVYNGIDVLTKRVRYRVIDKWYHGDSLKGKDRVSYHEDHGEGADFFQVGKSLGCGATAILSDGKLCQAGLFPYYRIIANGPVRAIFEVYYPDIDAGGKKYLEIKKFTLDAGSNLNKIEDLIIGEASGLPVELVCGLVKRGGVSLHKIGDAGGLSLWGPTNSDPVNGFLGTAVLVPDNKITRVYEDSIHAYALCSVLTGKPFTYYTGAGWTRSGDFKNIEDWLDYLENYMKNLETPLVIDVKQ